MLFNSIGFSVCNLKRVDNIERSSFQLLRYFVYAYVYSYPCIVEESSLTLIRFRIL